MTVSDVSFVDLLNDHRVDDEKILVALRYYVAELTDDKLPEELREEVVEDVGGDTRAVEQAVRQLTKDRSAEVAAALALFSSQWGDPAERERIVRAFQGSGTKLPVIEAGLIAIVAMYGMFLLTTGGRKSRMRTVRRRADGTFEETLGEEMWGPTGPLQAIVELIRPVRRPGSPPGD